MTDKLKCPFCSDELVFPKDKLKGIKLCVCRNPTCKYDGWHFPKEIIHQLIEGNKARDALKRIANYMYAKDENNMKWHVLHLKKIARDAITEGLE